MKIKNILGIMDDTLDILVSKFREYYEIEFEKPDINTGKKDYMSSEGVFIPIKECGVIKVCEDYCLSKRRICSVTAHELGHSAAYQNCKEYRMREKDVFVSDCIGEGIGCEFQEKGIKFLREEGYLSKKELLLENSIMRMNNLISLSSQPEYFIGKQLIKYMKKRGLRVKNLVESPFEYRDYLKNLISYKIFC